MTDLEVLKDKIRRRLDKETKPKSIPELSDALKERDEYNMLVAISDLEDSGEIILNGFDRVYREDGGAIYLALYSKKIASA